MVPRNLSPGPYTHWRLSNGHQLPHGLGLLLEIEWQYSFSVVMQCSHLRESLLFTFCRHSVSDAF